MEKLLPWLLLLTAVVIPAILVFEPKFDRNTETGKIIFWYNWNHQRKYIEL